MTQLTGYEKLLRVILNEPVQKTPKSTSKKARKDPIGSLLKHVEWPHEIRIWTFDTAEMTRKRDVSFHPNCKSGEFWSDKNKKPIQYETAGENKFYRKLESSPLVRAYVEQPIKLPFDGGASVYYPDVMVQLGDSRLVFVEVKPVAKMQDDENIRRLPALRSFCETAGFGFLLTDGEFASQQLLEHAPNVYFRDGLLDELIRGPVHYWQVKELMNSHNASRKDLLSIILQYDLFVCLSPWTLAVKKKNRMVSTQQTFRKNRPL